MQIKEFKNILKDCLNFNKVIKIKDYTDSHHQNHLLFSEIAKILKTRDLTNLYFLSFNYNKP